MISNLCNSTFISLQIWFHWIVCFCVFGLLLTLLTVMFAFLNVVDVQIVSIRKNSFTQKGALSLFVRELEIIFDACFKTKAQHRVNIFRGFLLSKCRLHVKLVRCEACGVFTLFIFSGTIFIHIYSNNSPEK